MLNKKHTAQPTTACPKENKMFQLLQVVSLFILAIATFMLFVDSYKWFKQLFSGVIDIPLLKDVVFSFSAIVICLAITGAIGLNSTGVL